MKRLRLTLCALVTFAALAQLGCYCIEDEGDVFDCACARRCNGVSDSFAFSGCNATAADAQASCGRSCSPEATCTACTCTRTVRKCLDSHCR